MGFFGFGFGLNMRLNFGLLHVPQPRFTETVFNVSFFLELDMFLLLLRFEYFL